MTDQIFAKKFVHREVGINVERLSLDLTSLRIACVDESAGVGYATTIHNLFRYVVHVWPCVERSQDGDCRPAFPMDCFHATTNELALLIASG